MMSFTFILTAGFAAVLLRGEQISTVAASNSGCRAHSDPALCDEVPRASGAGDHSLLQVTRTAVRPSARDGASETVSGGHSSVEDKSESGGGVEEEASTEE